MSQSNNIDKMILPDSFYQRPVLQVAQDLLGATLITQIDGHYTSAIIVETEAYAYPNDKGSHTYNHKRTPKNESMYLSGGHIYVYKCYGVHDMFNIVVEDEGIGSAVLVRAVQPLEGIDIMQRRRGLLKSDHTLTGGPGKVCQAMGITQQYDGLKLWRDQHNIIIEAPHRPVPISCVTPRVGMSSRVAECANWPYRFYIKSNYVSRPLTISYDF